MGDRGWLKEGWSLRENADWTSLPKRVLTVRCAKDRYGVGEGEFQRRKQGQKLLRWSKEEVAWAILSMRWHPVWAGRVHSQGVGFSSQDGHLPDSPAPAAATSSSGVDCIPTWMFTMTSTSLSGLCLLFENLPSWCLTPNPTTSCKEILLVPTSLFPLGSSSGHWLLCCPRHTPDPPQLCSGCSGCLGSSWQAHTK